MIGVTILGSTGTIGVNTLDVISRNPERFHVVALTANRNVELMAEQVRRWQPLYAVMADEAAAAGLREALAGAAAGRTQILSGAHAVADVAALPEADQVMAGIVGAAGLLPSLAAARAGKRVLLANKEALVMSGQLFMDAVSSAGAELLPIDSEHNAIFQCMPGRSGALDALGVRRILLTASGGPFREMPLEAFDTITPEQAVAHPNWVMGRKISVDSATMMNKGLELIEACWLFDTDIAHIDVVLHRQSVIHSMVEYSDGSVLAQMGNPDMRTPIAHAMAWPERIDAGVESLDLFSIARLDFQAPDEARFPCLGLAREAMRRGGTATAVLNAANEVAVEAFLNRAIRFTDIPVLVESALDSVAAMPADSLEIVLEADRAARAAVHERIPVMVT